MQEKSKLQLVAEAQEEQIQIIAERRLALRIALDDMDRIGGKDEYEPSLPMFLEKYNVSTVTTDILREVYTDARQLKKVIAKLKTEGKITVEEKGQTTTITFVKVAALKTTAEPVEATKANGK